MTTTMDAAPAAKMNGPMPGQPAPKLPATIAAKPQPKPAPEKEKPRTVGKMEAVEIRIPELMAALLCTNKDDGRPALAGVYLHRTADGFVRAVATDGTRCLIANLHREAKDKPGPKWLDAGVIVPADGLAQRLKLIAKEHGDQLHGVMISYGENQPRLEIADAFGTNVFRVLPVPAEFPPYEKFTMTDWSGVGTERADWKPTGFRPEFLKGAAEVAKVLGSKTISCFDYAGAAGGAQPVLFTFGAEADGVALFVMPVPDAGKLGEGNRLLLAPAIRSSLAALRAHETRNRDAAKALKGADKDIALAKADAFAARIKAALEQAGNGNVAPALPAPKPPKPAKPAKSKAPAKK